jgi:Fe-S-cluster containining protein
MVLKMRRTWRLYMSTSGECRKCGRCCNYVAFTMSVNRKTAKALLKDPLLILSIQKPLDADMTRYFDFRKILVRPDKLIVPNYYPKNNLLEKISNNKYRLIIYCPCVMLKDNLCMVWDNRPSVCDKTRRTGAIWTPPECTDKGD